MDGRHALRIGADQRPQKFRPRYWVSIPRANDLLASGGLFGLGVGHIHCLPGRARSVLVDSTENRAMPSSSCSSAIFWNVACMAK